METWLADLLPSESYLAAYSDNSLGLTSQDPGDHRKIDFSPNGSINCRISSPKFESKNSAEFESYEGFGGLLPTTLSAIKFALDEFRPDLIIRTNVSSYWNLEILRRVVEELPSHSFYGGVAGPIPRSISKTISTKKYASGAGAFMSPDVAQLLLDNADSLDLNLIDDLSIGIFMNSHGIQLTEMNRFDLNYPSDCLQLSDKELGTNYHYRCKSGTFSRRDIKIMKTLHKRLKG